MSEAACSTSFLGRPQPRPSRRHAVRHPHHDPSGHEPFKDLDSSLPRNLEDAGVAVSIGVAARRSIAAAS